MVWMTWHALYGPEPLPVRIPIHFDAAGNPNGWGSPSSLLELAAVAVVLYLGISLTARFPSAFNFPAQVTAENRPRLEALALDMIAWVKMEMICIFAWIQWFTIKVARQGKGALPPVLLPICFVALFGITVWYIVAMRRAARAGLGS